MVGAGIMGASTALALSNRGHQVDLYEQFEPGHDRGSSHGRSRIVRRAYPDAFYTAIMQDGYPMWATLAQRLGEPILHECGLLYFGRADSTNVLDVVAALTQHEVPHRVLSPTEVGSVFPELRLGPSEVGVLTPEAGWVHAEAAVLGSIRLAVDQGVRVVRERIADPQALLEQYDRVLVCAGSWILNWVSLPAQVGKQTFAYVATPQPQAGPVWIADSDAGMYGFPSEPGASTVKIGVHRPGPEVHPDDPGRVPESDDLELICEFVRSRFSHPAAVVESKACLYTTFADEDFRFGSLGDRLFWASPCSGHGFKFGPWVGSLMADFAEGVRDPSEFPRFTAR